LTTSVSQALVLALCEGRDGSIWAGADFDGGLTRLKDGKMTQLTWKDGLIKAPVRVIHEDQTGNLWVGTSRGLSRWRDGKFTNYTSKDGLAGDVVRAIWEDHLGSLWFGTESGLSRWSGSQFINLTRREGL